MASQSDILHSGLPVIGPSVVGSCGFQKVDFWKNETELRSNHVWPPPFCPQLFMCLKVEFQNAKICQDSMIS